jgi:cytochrome c556
MDGKDLKQIEGLFKHHVGILAEDFQHKLDIVVEGQQMLAEKLEATRIELKEEIQKVDNRLTSVEARLVKKIDAVAADLSAHRKDTEAHHGVYRVKEE